MHTHTCTCSSANAACPHSQASLRNPFILHATACVRLCRVLNMKSATATATGLLQYTASWTRCALQSGVPAECLCKLCMAVSPPFVLAMVRKLIMICHCTITAWADAFESVMKGAQAQSSSFLYHPQRGMHSPAITVKSGKANTSKCPHLSSRSIASTLTQQGSKVPRPGQLSAAKQACLSISLPCTQHTAAGYHACAACMIGMARRAKYIGARHVVGVLCRCCTASEDAAALQLKHPSLVRHEAGNQNVVATVSKTDSCAGSGLAPAAG